MSWQTALVAAAVCLVASLTSAGIASAAYGWRVYARLAALVLGIAAGALTITSAAIAFPA